MDRSAFENPWVKRTRALIHMIIISVALNIGLFVSLLYIVTVRNRDFPGERLLTRPINIRAETIVDKLEQFSVATYEELLVALEDTTLLEYGYRARDLALSSLVKWHYFSLERALPDAFLHRREAMIEEEGNDAIEIALYPGLEEEHFSHILAFAHTEECPFTSEGVFYALQKDCDRNKSSLMEVFYVTEEFYIIHTVVTRCFGPVCREEIVPVILDTTWENIRLFAEQIKTAEDVSLDVVRHFFAQYLLQSSQAIHFWVRYDGDYLLQCLDDSSLVACIEQLRTTSSEVTHFLRSICCSVRSPMTKRAAENKLSEILAKEGEMNE